MPWRFDLLFCFRGRARYTARCEMPKLKTKSGAKKLFKITASGRVKAGVAGKRHRLISHSSKYIRQQRGTKVMADADTKNIKSWLPYG
jgi:large subunit ribosomal protein L35